MTPTDIGRGLPSAESSGSSKGLRSAPPNTTLTLRFQPFQLYPELPERDGIDKASFFLANSKRVRPDEMGDARDARRQRVVEAWREEGLALNDVYGSTGGKLGNSFDAQRLILLARAQGKENEAIEAVYTLNHTDGKYLCDRETLLAAATRAGVVGATAMLESGAGAEEVRERIRGYHSMGITAVPVLIINSQWVLQGYPEAALLEAAFARLIETGSL